MQEKDSIQILEEMTTGMLCSIELPLTNWKIGRNSIC